MLNDAQKLAQISSFSNLSAIYRPRKFTGSFVQKELKRVENERE